jgi:TonB family protein
MRFAFVALLWFLAIPAHAAGAPRAAKIDRAVAATPGGPKALPEGTQFRFSQPGSGVASRGGPVGRPLAHAGRVTIAPFPAAGDTSRAAAERMKRMNVPKAGMTTIAPLPPPAAPPGWPQDQPESPPPPGDDVFDVFPEVIDSPAPIYPQAAREKGIQGVVLVEAHVLAGGTVGETKVVRSIPGLDEAAMTAVRGWRFRPARHDGKPAPAWVAVPVRFTLH